MTSPNYPLESLDLEKQALFKQLAKQLQKLQCKEEELLKNLKQCEEWQKIQHEGELIKFHFTSIKKGISSIQVHDWLTDESYDLPLDPLKTPQEQMAACFKKAKKWQRGLIPLQNYLERIRNEIHKVQQQQQEVHAATTSEELQLLKKKPAPVPLASKKESSLPIYREYQSESGLKIWVGKNAKANEHLTFQLANGRDWWLHVNGCPGSHVIIRLPKNQEPDPETLKDAMELALYYSKARQQGEGEVCLTQRKYVSRLGRGKTGLVQIANHQTVWVKRDMTRYNALKERRESL